MADPTTYKGFIKDLHGNKILPITRAELLLDSEGKMALFSKQFLASADHPGLMSAEDYKKLSGGSGISVGDLNTKLNYINEGFKVGESSLKFYNYDENNILKGTPITLKTDNSLLVTQADNVITFALKSIGTEKTLANTAKHFIDAISVDEYGRVTNVTNRELTNDDLPNIISKELSNCTTTVPENAGDTALVNKKYVDSKFNIVSAGALKFGGTITSTIYEDKLKIDYINHYYKVIGSFTLAKKYLYSEDGDITVKSGDTLIVYKDNDGNYKFVYIPSGDDEITAITTTITAIQGGTNLQTHDTLLGDVNIQFDAPLSVMTDKNHNSILVGLSQATSTASGYLSADDYKKFSQYAAKTMTITPSLTSGYEIGKITLDGKDTILYGKDYSLTLKEDETSKNPYLKFNDTSFTFESSSTIGVKKSESNTIQFTGLYTSGDENLLTIGNNTITVVKGSASNKNGVVIYDDFSTLSTIVSNHLAIGLTSEIITNSLNTNDGNADYYYGSNKLKAAITIKEEV